MNLYDDIKSKFHLWHKTQDMIIQRKHSYLNKDRIEINCITNVAGCRMISFHLQDDPSEKELFYYAPRKHHLITKNPEGKLAKTIVYTGKLLKPGIPN